MLEVDVNIHEKGTEIDVIDYDTGAEYLANVGTVYGIRLRRAYPDKSVERKIIELLFHNVSDRARDDLKFIAESFDLKGKMTSDEHHRKQNRYSLTLPVDSKIEIKVD